MSLTDQILDLAIQIQQIPAPTFAEGARAAFVRTRFMEAERLTDVEIDADGNVFARLPGAGDAPPLVVSAHLDTVFPHDTDLSVRRTADKISAPGIGDNSLGVAGLFGLLWQLRSQRIPLPGDLWLVANVCEEGLGDLKGMRAVVDRFGDTPRAYIILEGMMYGEVVHRALGVQRYRITVRTEGGHSWADYGRPSAVHELAGLVARLTALKLPAQPRTTLNVGMISGGTSVNTIAARASLELDLRSEEAGSLQNLVREVEALVAAANRPGVDVRAAIIGQRPAGYLSKDHPLVQKAVQSLKMQGEPARLLIGSTDANIPLSRGLPGVCIGLTRGGGAHTLDEFIDPTHLEKGMAQLVNLVERCA